MMRKYKRPADVSLRNLHNCIAEVGPHDALMAVATHVINRGDHCDDPDRAFEIGAELVELAAELRKLKVG